jgi:hypothetical protein
MNDLLSLIGVSTISHLILLNLQLIEYLAEAPHFFSFVWRLRDELLPNLSWRFLTLIKGKGAILLLSSVE